MDFPCPTKELHLEYGGLGDELTSDGRNQVGPTLVELSLYGGWYPLQKIDEPPIWNLSAALPEGWTWASNGADATMSLSSLRSAKPADIALVAAPNFIESRSKAGPVGARLLLRAVPSLAERQQMQTVGQAGADMAGWLIRLLGPAKGATRPVIAFPPRGGSLSYSRLPLVVLSQSAVADDGDRPPRLNIRHEIAHFWSTAETTADQWISEGVAEYLAVRRTAERREAGGQKALINLYRAKVREAGNGAIVDNAETDGPVGFSARYARPVLLFNRLSERHGWPKVAALLRRSYDLGGKLTTERFLQLIGAQLGSSERTLVDRCLHEQVWPAECGG